MKNEEKMKLYIGNINKKITATDIKEIFSQIGNVSNIKILKKYKNNPKCIILSLIYIYIYK